MQRLVESTSPPLLCSAVLLLVSSSAVLLGHNLHPFLFLFQLSHLSAAGKALRKDALSAPARKSRSMQVCVSTAKYIMQRPCRLPEAGEESHFPFFFFCLFREGCRGSRTRIDIYFFFPPLCRRDNGQHPTTTRTTNGLTVSACTVPQDFTSRGPLPSR